MFELMHTETDSSPAVGFVNKRLLHRYEKMMRTLEEGQSDRRVAVLLTT